MCDYFLTKLCEKPTLNCVCDLMESEIKIGITRLAAAVWKLAFGIDLEMDKNC